MRPMGCELSDPENPHWTWPIQMRHFNFNPQTNSLALGLGTHEFQELWICHEPSRGFASLHSFRLFIQKRRSQSLKSRPKRIDLLACGGCGFGRTRSGASHQRTLQSTTVSFCMCQPTVSLKNMLTNSSITKSITSIMLRACHCRFGYMLICSQIR